MGISMTRSRFGPRISFVLTGILLYTMFPLTDVGAAEPFADPAFRAIWDRTDGLVAASTVQRTFLWGPAPISAGVQEKYAQSPNGMRLVQYFDKSRMEITNPTAAQNSSFFVTNGLLVIELMTGRVQTGNDPAQVETHDPANVNAVGDSDDANAPTYLTLAKLRDQPARAMDTPIREAIDRNATIANGGPEGVTTAVLVPETRHAVASVFWTFMNSSGPIRDAVGGATMGALFANPFYATGFPITDAYWATVKVGGAQRQVLMQAFERRVLTYTPGNPTGFEVEAGNVGQHYYQWRYQSRPSIFIDPIIPIGPIQPVNVLAGKYSVISNDLPDRFQITLDGEASNGFLAKNNTDPNYGTYLKQWQRISGYRRVFVRNEAGNQVSAIQSIISVFRTADGALAALMFDRDQRRNQPMITVMDGPFTANSYLLLDRTSDTMTQYSLVWQQGNVLARIDVTAPPRGGPTVADTLDLAQKISRRLAADITP